MPGESLHAAVEALRARLQSDLDAQLAEFQTRLESHHQDAVTGAARAADEAWSARFAAASAESAQTLVEERTRLAAEHAAALEAAVPRTSNPAEAGLTRLADAMARIGQSPSLSATLDALVAAASAHAERVALSVVIAPGAAHSEGWAAWGPRSDAHAEAGDLVAAASTSARPETSADGTRIAIPLIVGDRPVAILQAASSAAAPRFDVVVALALHTAACLGRLTAVRVTQVMMGSPGPGGGGDHGSARRYARLLVSEIKLYNEAAVRTGRERGDLLARLRPEIERARRLYEQRVPASQDRASLFHHELVDTLAAGDPSRLGASGA